MTEEIEEFDYVVVGSSLTNGLLSNVLGWKGFRVLSIDENSYYGDYTASLSLDQVEQKYSEFEIEYKHDFIEQNKPKFGLDLIPSYILCNSKMIDYISNFNIYRYIEVTKLQDFYTYNHKQSFDKLKTTKEDIFTDTSMSPITKRTIMKCIKFLIRDDTVNDPDMVNTKESDEIWEKYKEKPLIELFQTKFKKLPENLLNEFVYTICNSFDITKLSTSDASAKVTKFFKSYNIHGKFPALLTKYSGLVEIIQGIYRSAALINNILRLETSIESYDAESGIIKLSSGESYRIKEKIVLSHHQKKSLNQLNVTINKTSDVYRGVVFVKGAVKYFDMSVSNGCVVSFPPESSINGDYKLKSAVQLMILSSSLERCIKDYETVQITALDEEDMLQIKKYLDKNNDVGMMFEYTQEILDTTMYDDKVVVMSDSAEPCSFDIDHCLNLAMNTYDVLMNNNDNGGDFMSVNLPSNDD